MKVKLCLRIIIFKTFIVVKISPSPVTDICISLDKSTTEAQSN